MILADHAIPGIKTYLAPLGPVVYYNDRASLLEALPKAKALIVRSVTKVDATCLDHAPNLEFVGSCTAGVDHIDLRLLIERSITFANAAGANAAAVAEYVLSAAYNLNRNNVQTLKGSQVGIIGAGFVGSAVYKLLVKQLGAECFVFDPYVDESSHAVIPKTAFVPSIDKMMHVDLITVHCNLHHKTDFPTDGLLGHDFFECLPTTTRLINAARGEVIIESALLNWLEKGGSAALDVWQNEPDISTDLLKQVCFATPHIAGHTIEAKLSATLMIAKAYARYLKISAPCRDSFPDLLDLPNIEALIHATHLEAVSEQLKSSSCETIIDSFRALRRQHKRHGWKISG